MRTKTELSKRYFIFFISLFLQGFAIAMVARANLGNTPISSPNYVLSLHTPLSLGEITFLFNILLIVIQYFLWPKAQRKEQYLQLFLQIPISFIFAASIDVGMMVLNLFLAPTLPYIGAFSLLILGAITLAFSVSLQVTANATMISGEATVKLIATRLKFEFGYVKMAFDLTLVFLAVIFSLIFTKLSAIEGVREGTLIGALCVGPLVRIFMPKLKFLNTWFTKDLTSIASQTSDLKEDFKLVITIAREYGCEGRIIGKKLADDLKLAFYDTDLIQMISKESGLSLDYVSQNDQAMDSSLLYEMIMQDYFAPPEKSMSKQDALYVACAKVIRSLAKEKACVIVGRGANDILKDNPKCLNVFLYAPLDKKLQFCKEHYHQDKEEALKAMSTNDKRRAEHYLHYTGKNINDPKNYHLSLDVGTIGIENCAKVIESLVKEKLKA